jgi:hypothetical protein
MIEQIKKDHTIVTSGEHARNLAEVEYRVEAERRMTGYVSYLLDELEKANKEVERQENKYQTMFREMLPIAQQRDQYYADLEIMRTEHTAMKEALEWYDKASDLDLADDGGMRARHFLSKLKCTPELS